MAGVWACSPLGSRDLPCGVICSLDELVNLEQESDCDCNCGTLDADTSSAAALFASA
jgi:hypothetical protein